ncbi:TetR/AcrR family transcriptional regulator [Paenibacillus sp. J2TS4]|uniref:TetR/AcrR family transcriptional regulator n=1 Tax=Paenibacillus sp. J2TS4 TaxID=2807194 RepID=UPI001B08241B|nr:TetR family transcriptional regulator [Paenibacillus sp. J2TS4]GIP35233.1 TetR family transcriptional regulator [Paenibacillus sp. J2TS4]
MNHKLDESKKRILEAAKVCFANNGYSGTSVRQICEAADANLALVSYYFGSKENLYYTVIDYLYHINDLELDKPITNPREALYHFIDTFVHMRKQDKQFNMLLRHELSSENTRKEAISKIVTPYFDHLERILTTGKEEGVFHYESLDLILIFIISILVYPAYDSFLIDPHLTSESELMDEIKQTADFIFAGLHCQPANPI